MRILLISLVIILLFISQINTLIDIDLWWNLKTGEYIVKNLSVPRTDIFSYALYNKPWIDHEWLSQISFYLVFSKFGFSGLNLLKAFIVSLCFLILIFLVHSRYKRLSFALFFTLLSVLAFGYRSFVRPEIFSYLFLCVFLYILEKENRLFILPFLQIIWSNLHGYFILGPILIFLYTVGEFFSGNKNKARTLTKVFILALLATFVNPYFYKGALYPFEILMDTFTRQRLWMQNVHELKMPIRLSLNNFFFFWVLAILTSITFLVNLKNVKIKHVAVFTFSFIASYIAVRNIPILIFIAMPLASMNLNEARLTRDTPEKKYYSILTLLICTITYFFISNNYYTFVNQSIFRKTESTFSRIFVPSGACNFLEQNEIKGRIFNTLDFGPYIGYRFYPERRIFIDTRTDLYKDDFYLLYTRAQNYPREWEGLHERYGFNIVLLRHLFSGTERIIRYLYRHKDWQLVYYDMNSCIFLNNTPQMQKFIDKFGIDFKERSVEDSDISINIARFFEKIEETQLAEKVYLKLLEKNIKFLEAGNNLAAIYINTERCEKGIELLQKFLSHYPKAAELYANMGIACLCLGEKEKAILLLEKSAKLDPYLRRASYMLGVMYLEKGDIDRAMRQFVKYIRLDPYDAGIHRLLGDIYAKKGLLKEAQEEYNEANALKGS